MSSMFWTQIITKSLSLKNYKDNKTAQSNGLGCFYNLIPPHHQLHRRHRLVGLGQVLGLVGVRPLGPPVLAE